MPKANHEIIKSYGQRTPLPRPVATEPQVRFIPDWHRLALATDKYANLKARERYASLVDKQALTTATATSLAELHGAFLRLIAAHTELHAQPQTVDRAHERTNHA